MRLLGAKIGKHAEMSTVWSFMPELLEAAISAFFADGCMFGGRRDLAADLKSASITSATGASSATARSCRREQALATAASLASSSAPPSPGETTPEGTDWLGSPSFRLPNRKGRRLQRRGDLPAEPRRLRPARRRRRVAHPDPLYTAFALGLAGLAAVLYGYEVCGMAVTFALLPALGLLAAAIWLRSWFA